MALIPTQDVPAVGVDNITLQAAVGPDTAASGGGVSLVVKNTDAAAKTITVTTPGLVDGLAIADIVRTVPATTGIAIIPLIGRLVGATATITYSAVTGVTVGVIKVAK